MCWAGVVVGLGSRRRDDSGHLPPHAKGSKKSNARVNRTTRISNVDIHIQVMIPPGTIPAITGFTRAVLKPTQVCVCVYVGGDGRDEMWMAGSWVCVASRTGEVVDQRINQQID
jgi:hypothetical protein